MKEKLGENEEDSTMLPPRSIVHPSNKAKITRVFYMSLVLMFIALVISLIIWGANLKEAALT